jgi:hypothetical protein
MAREARAGESTHHMALPLTVRNLSNERRARGGWTGDSARETVLDASKVPGGTPVSGSAAAVRKRSSRTYAPNLRKYSVPCSVMLITPATFLDT